MGERSAHGREPVSEEHQSMIVRRVAATGAVAAGVMAMGIGPATAADQPTAGFVRAVAGPGAATVQFTYTCHSDISPDHHLFVALKQGSGVSVEHSSTEDPDAHVAAFYSTNWKVDSGPNAVTCDGRQHLATVVLKNDPFWASQGNTTPIKRGSALVQICLFDNGEDEGGAVFDYSMQNVVAGVGR
jgi:hypothetical protein